jgi:hypothetical protein
MSKLGLHTRPIVLFDAGNKMHRQWVVSYLKTGSWGDCPVRFTVKEDYGNLIGHIQRELILWYGQNEIIDDRQSKVVNIVDWSDKKNTEMSMVSLVDKPNEQWYN